MRKVDIAYIAGFFDGDGNISILKTDTHYNLSVSISNTNLTVLKDIQKIFEGSLQKKKKKISNKHRSCFDLKLSANKAKNFLEITSPYLKIKKEQAALAIQFQSLRRKGRLTISKEEQENYRVKINSFNKSEDNRRKIEMDMKFNDLSIGKKMKRITIELENEEFEDLEKLAIKRGALTRLVAKELLKEAIREEK